MNLGIKRKTLLVPRLLGGAMLVLFFFSNGCATQPPPKPGTEIVRFDDPAKAELKDAPADGKYGCYRQGIKEPLETATLKKGDKIGFEVLSPSDARGQMTPQLFGVAGKQHFLLPLGDQYAWKRM